jgi:hypothetical protein
MIRFAILDDGDFVVTVTNTLAYYSKSFFAPAFGFVLINF